VQFSRNYPTGFSSAISSIPASLVADNGTTRARPLGRRAFERQGSQRDVAAPRAAAGMQLSTPSMHPPSKSAASRDLAGKGHQTTGHVELARRDAAVEEAALIQDASGSAGERGETRDVKARPYPFPETRGRRMEKEPELKSSSNTATSSIE